jgi:hypothetical protein
VTAGHEGFKQTVMGKVELLVNRTARVNVALQVGAIADSVEVIGAAPLVASETSTLGHVVTTKQIEDLPLKGRAVFNLALLSPGTAPRRQALRGPAASDAWWPGFPGFSPPEDGQLERVWLTNRGCRSPLHDSPMFPPMDSMQNSRSR